jgi:hypothetical protein
MAKSPTPSVSTRFVRRAALSLALGLPLGAACSLVLDLEPGTPCTNDDECMYTNGQGSCVGGFCQPGRADDTTDGGTTMGPGPATETTAVTLDSTTTDPTVGEDTDTSTTDTPVECTLNSQCGQEQRCGSGGTCVDLLSAECDILQWPDSGPGGGRDNVVFLGSIMSTSGIFASLVQPLENAFQLAVEDFNNVATLQNGAKIAWVGCDATGGIAAATAAAEHLRDNVEAPAIVGPIFSEQAREIAEAVTVPADIFVISPTASAPSLSNFDDDNLLWRVTPSDVFQANALEDRFLVDLSPAPQRILLLNKDDAYGNELRELIQTSLATTVPHVYFATYPPPETFASQGDLLNSYGAILATAFTQPGIAQNAGAYDSPDDHYTHIIILGTSEAEAFIVNYLGIWAGSYSTFAPFPLVTVSHGAVPNLPTIISNVGVTQGTEPLAPLRPLLHASVRGTSPNIFDVANYTAFSIRYRIRFNDQDPLTSSSLGYDAAMATMFAMVTVPSDQPITGSAIAAGMASLNDPAGVSISFGDQVAVFVQAARNALAAGGTVDLRGVSGALDWDPGNGEIRADVLGWRLGGSPDMPVLEPYCLYLLDPPPAEDGIWLNVGTGMPPCG